MSFPRNTQSVIWEPCIPFLCQIVTLYLISKYHLIPSFLCQIVILSKCFFLYRCQIVTQFTDKYTIGRVLCQIVTLYTSCHTIILNKFHFELYKCLHIYHTRIPSFVRQRWMNASMHTLKIPLKFLLVFPPLDLEFLRAIPVWMTLGWQKGLLFKMWWQGVESLFKCACRVVFDFKNLHMAVPGGTEMIHLLFKRGGCRKELLKILHKGILEVHWRQASKLQTV